MSKCDGGTHLGEPPLLTSTEELDAFAWPGQRLSKSPASDAERATFDGEIIEAAEERKPGAMHHKQVCNLTNMVGFLLDAHDLAVSACLAGIGGVTSVPWAIESL